MDVREIHNHVHAEGDSSKSRIQKESDLDEYYEQIQRKLEALHNAVKQGDVEQTINASSTMAKIVVKAEEVQCDLLHSPQVEDKRSPRKTIFSKMRKIMPKDSEPSDSAPFSPNSDPLREGLLKKKSRLVALWKTRYCAVYRDEFVYWKDKEHRTIMPKRFALNGCEVIKDKNSCSFLVKDGKSTWYFDAKDDQERSEWIKSLNTTNNARVRTETLS
eukprot:TRINITY_DN11855_c0_g1_i1.p1 TRINITY_DN11855_c0_g1~~TRINITY_DN11855_c0_g1_i1.p1  ORF type:complete len:217 (-),score=44.15 TRINITY_DN11855_c0_g1_i1:68-718(-)